jgi:hypothetical protein
MLRGVQIIVASFALADFDRVCGLRWANSDDYCIESKPVRAILPCQAMRRMSARAESNRGDDVNFLKIVMPPTEPAGKGTSGTKGV